jgi:hypothetical protein
MFYSYDVSQQCQKDLPNLVTILFVCLFVCFQNAVSLSPVEFCWRWALPTNSDETLNSFNVLGTQTDSDTRFYSILLAIDGAKSNISLKGDAVLVATHETSCSH